MSIFSSNRERRLWLWTLAVIIAIYATLGLAQTLAEILRDRGLISNVIWVGLYLVVGAVIIQGLKLRPRGAEIGVALGVLGVYILVFMRMALPEERSHLIEYSIVGLLIYEALAERASQGRHVPTPALLAIIITSLVGTVDEIIQAFLPNRVFDYRDILFNIFAGIMAISASAILSRARQRFSQPN